MGPGSAARHFVPRSIRARQKSSQHAPQLKRPMIGRCPLTIMYVRILYAHIYNGEATMNGEQVWRGEYGIETSATPDIIWSIFRDAPGWKTWNAGIEHIDIDGPFSTGTCFTMKPPGRIHCGQGLSRFPRTSASWTKRALDTSRSPSRIESSPSEPGAHGSPTWSRLADPKPPRSVPLLRRTFLRFSQRSPNSPKRGQHDGLAWRGFSRPCPNRRSWPLRAIVPRQGAATSPDAPGRLARLLFADDRDGRRRIARVHGHRTGRRSGGLPV